MSACYNQFIIAIVIAVIIHIAIAIADIIICMRVL